MNMKVCICTDWSDRVKIHGDYGTLDLSIEETYKLIKALRNILGDAVRHKEWNAHPDWLGTQDIPCELLELPMPVWKAEDGRSAAVRCGI